MTVGTKSNIEAASEPLYPRAAMSTLPSFGNIEGIRARGHSRSASHGGTGTTLSPATSVGAIGRPSALKNSGHQRAFSQGMIETESGFVKGHNRGGSKTDFILPPGHRDSETVPSINVIKKSGHSRQASRSESIYTLRHNAPPPKWRQLLCSLFFCYLQPEAEEPRKRTVVPNHLVPPKTPLKLHPNGNRPDNRIRTTKYTFLSFLPKNLLEQFHRVANLYFIFIVLLNWFPSINAFGKEIAIIPVTFVLGVTAIKDLFEDRRRHASDKRINNSTVRVYVSEEERYKKLLWKDVRVGDLLHLSNNEVIPADLLLLRTSDPQGLCYIDTCNLDGESNLKQRQIPRGFADKQHDFTPNLFRSVVEVDAPTTKIYRFHGAIVHPTGERVPVGTENLLLRDCALKNTDFVEGIVVYAGHETKAMLNNNGPRYKRSSLERLVNGDIMWCVVLLLIFCLLGASGSWMWLDSFQNADLTIPFLPNSDSRNYEGFLTFWTFIIILQVMIPLSLYVTIEMTKLLQVYHIHNSIDLYDAENDKKVECRALNITEELGQIQYIFSDKTGTLTENKMIFRRCTIGGVDYNHPAPENIQNPKLRPKLCINPKLAAQLPQRKSHLHSNATTQSNIVEEFLTILALCNTVVIAKHPHYDFMNASGVIEQTSPIEMPSKAEYVQKINTAPTVSRYSRLTESRSITPSPTPLIKDQTDSEINPMPEDFVLSLRNSTSVRSDLIDIPETPMEMSSGLARIPSGEYIRTVSQDKNIGSLSPIPSSTESSPTVAPSKQFHLRPKLLNVPSILSNVVSRKINGNKNGVPSNTTQSTTPSESKPIYEAESPDELALVEMACSYNCRLTKRTPVSASILYQGNDLVEFDTLKILPFDSSRKCMSVIVKDPSSGKIVVYTKGADSTIFNRLAATEDLQSEQILLRTQQHLNTYAKQGLRVLVVAKRYLTQTFYNDWIARLDEAEYLTDTRERKLKDLYNEVENNFTLMGATGIEDRLQDGVAETIVALRGAGIVVWLLTGDKEETAINVAYSAKLFSANMELLKLSAKSKEAAEALINFYLNEIERNASNDIISVEDSRAHGSSHKMQPMANASKKSMKKKAIIVDGKTLTYILDRRSNLQKPFLELTRHCTSVVACRTTPLQKAYIVRIVKEELKVRTLAIGDGANDVSMIQTADVGIGISGQEGMQAVMASDFSMPRFKYLHKFLLVHGHWSYDRLARMILYFFYKNAIFVFLIFWYQLYCGFSGTIMIDQMYHMLYNLFFTSLPPIAIGVYDQDAPESLLLARPSLYKKGRTGEVYQRWSFWLTTAEALYQSSVIFYISVEAYSNKEVGLWEYGTTITTCCMWAMLGQIALETKSWTILHVLSFVVSIGSYYIFCLVYNSICMQCWGLPSNTWVLESTLGAPLHWLVVILTTTAALIPRFVIRLLYMQLWPDDVLRAVIEVKQATKRGENFLVSWSRSTSTSSIYRTSEGGPRDVNPSTMTSVG
uniref:Phospholipid-transporting ATPase n=1 Tax=Clastoptera arizonana TaxID=38151 RepID=A0A1B6DU11_9HEMI